MLFTAQSNFLIALFSFLLPAAASLFTFRCVALVCVRNNTEQRERLFKRLCGGKFKAEKGVNFFGSFTPRLYFCTPFGLSYGVTVALQILVLSVKVRILVAQQKALYVSDL
jgi:hypothetical protein